MDMPSLFTCVVAGTSYLLVWTSLPLVRALFWVLALLAELNPKNKKSLNLVDGTYLLEFGQSKQGSHLSSFKSHAPPLPQDFPVPI